METEPLFRPYFQESLVYSHNPDYGQGVCDVTAAQLETVRRDTLTVGVVKAGISHDQSNHLFLFPLKALLRALTI